MYINNDNNDDDVNNNNNDDDDKRQQAAVLVAASIKGGDAPKLSDKASAYAAKVYGLQAAHGRMFAPQSMVEFKADLAEHVARSMGARCASPGGRAPGRRGCSAALLLYALLFGGAPHSTRPRDATTMSVAQ